MLHFSYIANADTYQTSGDHITNVIDYGYLPPARLRLQINKITM